MPEQQPPSSPASLLEEMVIDIYASTGRAEISILYDRPLRKTLLGVLVEQGTQNLFFVYEDGERQDLGLPLKDEIFNSFQKVETVSLFQMDMKTKKPVSGKSVPVLLA